MNGEDKMDSREDIKIDVVVSETDKLCAFAGDFFEPADAEAMMEFAKRQGYRSEIITTDKRFKGDWNPYRKITHRDIDWSDPRVIFKVIQMQKEGKTDDDIIDALHSESTAFAIITHSGRIWKAFSLWRDGVQGEVTDEMVMDFCKRFVANN